MDTGNHRLQQNSQMLRAPRLAPILPPSTGYSAATPHPMLTYKDPAMVNYDLRRPPSNARPRYPHFVGLSWEYESAMSPAVTTLTLTCGILPQPIVVTPSHSGFGFVIIRDVLLAVHSAYQVAVNELHVTVNAAPDPGSGPTLLREHSTVLTRHMWGGISESIAHGEWRVHIE